MSSQEQKNQSLHVPTNHTGRIRSHSLKPQHSRIDYARRKSAADLSTPTISSFEEIARDESTETIMKLTPPSWFKRRFTFFSIEKSIEDNRRMKANSLSNLHDTTVSNILKQKRPSAIVQLMEVAYILCFLLLFFIVVFVDISISIEFIF